MAKIIWDLSIRRAFTDSPRPPAIVRHDFAVKYNMTLNDRTCWLLAFYPRKQYDAILRLVGRVRAAGGYLTKLKVVPAEKITKIDIDRIPTDFFLERIDGSTLQLTDLRVELNRYLKRTLSSTGKELPRLPEPTGPAPAPAILEVAPLLTDDLLFKPNGNDYPRSPAEYHELMAKLVDAQGRFPDDAEGLTPHGWYAPKGSGAKHLRLKRHGRMFDVEILSPSLQAPGLKNRLVFDADLLSQAAAFEAYGTPGVSYDRQVYYQPRVFEAERAPFIRYDGMPVSFAALQQFQTAYGKRELPYAFIHFAMTYLYQGFGLTSYAVREAMSSMFYANAWQDRPALFIDKKGELDSSRFTMWGFAHSGRFTPFYSFVKGFGEVGEAQAPIAEAIIGDIHQRITPQAARRPEWLGIRQINGGTFPLALDRGVYPPQTRYPLAAGGIVFPQSERDLSTTIRVSWLEAIGGEEGVANGNGLYFGGLVTLGRIKAAKQREQAKQGGGMLQQVGDAIRRRAIGHTS